MAAKTFNQVQIIRKGSAKCIHYMLVDAENLARCQKCGKVVKYYNWDQVQDIMQHGQVLPPCGGSVKVAPYKLSYLPSRRDLNILMGYIK